MKVILKETIDSLGIIGTEVNVAKGYARNFLIPQKKAVLATPQNRKQMEMEKSKIDLQIAKEKEFAEEMAKRLEGVQLTLQAKVSEGEKLYGSVNVRDILDALNEKKISVSKNMILLKEPIKTIGTFKVPIRIYKEVEPEITVDVVSE
jgi:large subunit ribosomal protein L9